MRFVVTAVHSHTESFQVLNRDTLRMTAVKGPTIHDIELTNIETDQSFMLSWSDPLPAIGTEFELKEVPKP